MHVTLMLMTIVRSVPESLMSEGPSPCVEHPVVSGMEVDEGASLQAQGEPPADGGGTTSGLDEKNTEEPPAAAQDPPTPYEVRFKGVLEGQFVRVEAIRQDTGYVYT